MQEKLKQLKMKDGNVGKYIATFELLGQCARGDLDDPFLLTHFACSLPKALTDACIDMESLETFQEWKNAALCQQKNWMRKQALHKEYGSPNTQQLQGQGQNQGFNSWTWNYPQGQGQSQNQNWCSNQGNWPALPHPCLPSHNDNCMDISVVICKATTAKEKQEYHATGCYCNAGVCIDLGNKLHDLPYLSLSMDLTLHCVCLDHMFELMGPHNAAAFSHCHKLPLSTIIYHSIALPHLPCLLIAATNLSLVPVPQELPFCLASNPLPLPQ